MLILPSQTRRGQTLENQAHCLECQSFPFMEMEEVSLWFVGLDFWLSFAELSLSLLCVWYAFGMRLAELSLSLVCV